MRCQVVLRLLALSLGAFLSMTRASAQPAITDISFEQLDWYGYDGVTEVLVDENSSWGRFTFARETVTEIWYLNLSVALTEDGAPQWMVQNLPLFPDAVCDGACGLTVELDLTDLGLVSGDDWPTAHYEIALDTTPADGGPPTVTHHQDVASRARHMSNWPAVGGDIPKKAGKPPGHKAGGGGDAAVTDSSPDRGLEGVQEGDKQCFAGAMARSIAYLDKKFKLGIKKSAQDIFKDLVKKGVSIPNGEGQGPEDDWLEKKAEYLDPSGGVTKVIDPQQRFKKKLNKVIRVDDDEDDNFKDWFDDELDTEEDIEIAYSDGTTGHIVAVNRVYKQGKKTFVEYRDDVPGQGDDKVGDEKPKEAEIRFLPDGTATFDGHPVIYAISESPKRSPTGGDGGIGWTASKGGGKISDSKKKVSVPVKKGRSGKFFWTHKGDAHPGYGPVDFPASDSDRNLTFIVPRDRTITDWKAEFVNKNGSKSGTSGGNIKHHSPWAFYSLQALPPIPTRTPLLQPSEPSDSLAIYAAVNLDLYMAKNPMGPLNGMWEDGQSLDDVGISIAHGMIDGIEGLYFATTDFVLDPDSETGWVPGSGDAGWLDSAHYQDVHGPILFAGRIDFYVPPERVRGDMNCDTDVNFADIDGFVTALISRDDYDALYPDCDYFNGDINGDDAVNFSDIDGFVVCLIESGCP